MLKFLSSIFSHEKRVLQNSTTLQEPVSMWKDTGKVYYLENTLKLSFESDMGKVTFENLNFDKLSKILNKIQQNDDSLFNQKTTANIKDALTVSVCAVTWQQKDNSTRIKAIPQAAILRSKTAGFESSQAVFRHQQLLEHDDVLATTQVNGRDGVFTYSNVSVGQFIKQLEYTNNNLANLYKKQISVNQDNFKQAFTEKEEQAINNLLSIKNDDQQIIENNQRPNGNEGQKHD